MMSTPTTLVDTWTVGGKRVQRVEIDLADGGTLKLEPAEDVRFTVSLVPGWVMSWCGGVLRAWPATAVAEVRVVHRE